MQRQTNASAEWDETHKPGCVLRAPLAFGGGGSGRKRATAETARRETMIKRVWMSALGVLLLGAAVAEAGEHVLVLGEAELDAVAAGTATSAALGYALANGSVFASAGVRGTSNSSNTGRGSVSSTTTIAESTGVGTGGQGVTGGTTTGTGNAGRFSTVIPVHTVTTYGGSGVTLAHTTTAGF
jgi:hypothetical protein